MRLRLPLLPLLGCASAATVGLDPGDTGPEVLALNPRACEDLAEPWDLSTLDGVGAAWQVAYAPIVGVVADLFNSAGMFGDRDCPLVTESGDLLTYTGGCTTAEGVQYGGAWSYGVSDHGFSASGWQVVGTAYGAAFTFSADLISRLQEDGESWDAMSAGSHRWTGTPPGWFEEDVSWEEVATWGEAQLRSARLEFGVSPNHAAGGFCVDSRLGQVDDGGDAIGDEAVLQGAQTAWLHWPVGGGCAEVLVDGAPIGELCEAAQ